MPHHYLLKNALIFDGQQIRENSVIEIKNGFVRKIGIANQFQSSAIESIDLGGRLLLPGLVNPHHHLYSALATGLAPIGPTHDFQHILENLWWHLDKTLDDKSIYYSALNGLMQSVKYGVTTVFDHHASMNAVKGSLYVIEKAFRQMGLKGILAYEISDRMGKDALPEQLAENIDFFNTHRSDTSVRSALGMHANFTLSRKSMDMIAAHKPLDMPIHIHCGEAKADFDFCIEDGFSGPVDRLNSFGLLDSHSLLAHCIHLSNLDYQLLEDIQPIVISNPESNANNNVGMMDLQRIHKYVLGTDGMTGNILGTMRSHFLLRNAQIANPLSILFENSAQLVQDYFPDTGKIQEGFRADIAVTDYVPVTPISADNLFYHLIFGVQGKEMFITIADGNILYQHGKLQTIDEVAANQEISNAASALHRMYYE